MICLKDYTKCKESGKRKVRNCHGKRVVGLLDVKVTHLGVEAAVMG